MPRKTRTTITEQEVKHASLKHRHFRVHASERDAGLMPTRIHGQRSRRTERRQARQSARSNGWED